MTPERWQRIKELFHAALERQPDERTSFLAGRCAGDAALLAEVASLLERHRDDSFMEMPPAVLAMPVASRAAGGALDSGAVPVISASDLGLRSCPTCSSCYGDGRHSCPEDGASLVTELPGSPLIDSKYLIDRRLGHGGMGVVYRARHERLGRQFALKLIRPEASANAEFIARFGVEATALGRLKHPGIVDVTDFGIDPRDGGLPYLVMEHLEGMSLHEHVRRAGALSLDEALPILAAVAQALDFAHGQGVLHRDLKEANVFLCQRASGPPVVKILDFGLARLVSAVPGEPEQLRLAGDAAAPATRPTRHSPAPPDGPVPTVTLGRLVGRAPDEEPAPRDGRLTRPGQVGCTIDYAAPEVLRGEEATASSDIYSFAVMAYRLLVGRLPFEGNARQVAQGHLHAVPEAPSALRPSLPPELDGPLLGALAKDARSRPNGAADLVDSLRSAARRARRREWRRREVPRRLLLSAAGGVVLAIIGLAAARTGPLRKLELSTIDARFAVEPTRAPDPRLVLVVLDDASLAADDIPLPQKGDEFGRRLTALYETGARAVALDILAPRGWGRSEAFTRLVLEHSERLTLAAAAVAGADALGPESVEGLTTAALGPGRVAALFGLVNIEEDPDGVVRRGRLFFHDRDGGRRLTLAARAAMTLAGPALVEGAREPVLWIDHSVGWQQFPRISWKDLPQRLGAEPQLFRDRLVLVGATFAGSGDLDHRIPKRLSEDPALVPGVVLHALIVDSILAGSRYHEARAIPIAIGLWLALAVLLAGSVLLARPAWPALWLVVGGLLYLGLAIGVFRWGLIVPVATPLLAAAVTLGLGLALRAFLPRHPD
jgi:serine/threonine protein kinase